MNILVLYEDEVQELAAFAQKIKAGTGSEYAVKIRPVSEMAISELLAAQVLLLGIQDIKSPYWQEFKRIMNGINLAGRSAGCFLVKNAHDLAHMLAPTDITLRQESFSDPALVAEWLKSVKPFSA